MTTALTDRTPAGTQPYDSPEFTSLPQTPNTATRQSIWSRLHTDFMRLSRSRGATNEYAQWRQRHGWRATTPAELADDLRDNPAALGAVVQLYQGGSRLASAILVDAFRPALITFTRYTRIDACEQLDRPAVRAQTVLATFYDVASTTDAQSPSIAGRLYGETLKRVTRERPQIEQYPSRLDDLIDETRGTIPRCGRSTAGRSAIDSSGRRGARYVADCEHFDETHIDVAPIAARPGLDWERIERKGLARDVLATARDNGVITAVEHDILAARFLGDALVPAPTLARQYDASVSYCETKIRRALEKLAKFYATGDRIAESTVA